MLSLGASGRRKRGVYSHSGMDATWHIVGAQRESEVVGEWPARRCGRPPGHVASRRRCLDVDSAQRIEA